MNSDGIEKGSVAISLLQPHHATLLTRPPPTTKTGSKAKLLPEKKNNDPNKQRTT
jgi:hypothetical protein